MLWRSARKLRGINKNYSHAMSPTIHQWSNASCACSELMSSRERLADQFLSIPPTGIDGGRSVLSSQPQSPKMSCEKLAGWPFAGAETNELTGEPPQL